MNGHQVRVGLVGQMPSRGKSAIPVDARRRGQHSEEEKEAGWPS